MDLKFPSIRIGNQVWMSQNLDVTHFRNGDEIPEVTSNEAFALHGIEQKPAWCYYGDDPANGTKWGKLYNWYAVHDPRGLAPEGWIIPTEGDWLKLESTSGSDAFFRSQLSGSRGINGAFGGGGVSGYWWQHDPLTPIRNWGRKISVSSWERIDSFKRFGFAVRCIQQFPDGQSKLQREDNTN